GCYHSGVKTRLGDCFAIFFGFVNGQPQRAGVFVGQGYNAHLAGREASANLRHKARPASSPFAPSFIGSRSTRMYFAATNTKPESDSSVGRCRTQSKAARLNLVNY